jgi:hypothetical protein
MQSETRPASDHRSPVVCGHLVLNQYKTPADLISESGSCGMQVHEWDCLPDESANSQLYFEAAAQLVSRFWWLINFKWTDIFLKDIIGKIPQEWMQFLLTLDVRQIQEMMYTMQVPASAPKCLKQFVDSCKSNALRLRWTLHTYPIPADFKQNRYSDKKLRESLSLAEYVSSVCMEQHPDFRTRLTLVDIGCGLGYVSSDLNRKGFDMVGVECRQHLVDSCNKRMKSDTLRFVQHRADGSSESQTFLESLVPDDRIGVLLGLHCCGDLLDHIINLFIKSDRFCRLFTVTCCYHLIDENEFPRSRALDVVCEKERLSFDHISLRVGCQLTPWKWSNDLSPESMLMYAKSSLFRAVLEEVLVQTDYQWKKPKCHMKKSDDFDDYVHQVVVGFAPELREKAEYLLRDVFRKRKSQTEAVMVLKMLQTLIQPVMESLIVYDHVVKLREAGHSCFAVQVFSQLISPRNTLIVASKK